MRQVYLTITVLVFAISATTLIAQDRIASTQIPTQTATAIQSQAAIEKAAANGKYTFIFFYKEQNTQTDRVWNVIQPAASKLSDVAEVISVQVTNPAEKQIVDRYGVSRAPMPMVLAVAPCGAVTKGFTGTISEGQLRTALVSPGTAECMKALQDRKLVLLCVQPSSSNIREVSIQKGAQDFTTDKEYAASSKLLVLNAGDPAEASFLNDLKVDPKTTVPVTVLMAPPASVVGNFPGNVTKEQIVAKLKSAQSSCCPGGKCGPGGCCPAKHVGGP